MTKPKILGVRYACADPSVKSDFYISVLGMSRIAEHRFGYEGEGAWLEFETAKSADRYVANRHDLYWKIAIAVPDLLLACHQLRACGIEVSDPHQFQDVGYLAHFCDPEGFQIELIQHQFEGKKPSVQADENLLGGGPTLNLVTLRTTDITRVRALCEVQLGMKLLSIQPIKDYDFTLYFFAFTDEELPDSDLESLVNREWLYQRPYSILEVQHLHTTERVLETPAGMPGYLGTVLSGKRQCRKHELARLNLIVNS